MRDAKIITPSTSMPVGTVWLCRCESFEDGLGHAVIMCEDATWVHDPHNGKWIECPRGDDTGFTHPVEHPDPDQAYADLTAAQLLGQIE